MENISNTDRSALIITLPPNILGGVRTKVQILANYLISEGFRVTIAYYGTFSLHSELNVPFWKLPLLVKPKIKRDSAFNISDCHAVGSYLPELEFTYSLPSKLWRGLVLESDLHFVVGGSIVLGNILESFDIPYIIWCASDVEGDRYDRQKTMRTPRKILDVAFIEPVLKRQETKVVMGRGRILSVSRFTKEKLQKI